MFLCLKNNKAEEHKEYVSYVPMSKNNTMTHMYRTILLALPALLLLAACADDVTTPADPADTLAGQPVRFTATGLAVTPADAPRTRATQETDFPAEGSTMTVYMTGDGNTWQADYTFNGNTWEADGEPLLWPDTQNTYTFTAISPAGTDIGNMTLPTEWTAETLAEHEEIRTTATEVNIKATQSLDLTLRHALVKVQVISISGQPVTVKDGETFMQLYSADETTYEGYLTPASGTEGFQFISDNVYTVGTALEAGTVVTTWDDTEAVLINCPEPGKLSEAWTGNPQKVVITGTLDAKDMETIKGHTNEITHLYVMGGSINGNDWKSLNMSGATQLESVYLAEATSIRDFAFQQCSALTSVSLPEATSIGNNAFDQCSALTSVSLPEATSIGTYAFAICSQLTSASLPKATSIGDNAFYYCSALTSACLPKATSIGNRAFADCNTLTSVCLPEATTIGEGAFYQCNALNTLFLSDYTEENLDQTNFHGISWTDIYYGYKGTDGDYLKESNYAYHWPNN